MSFIPLNNNNNFQVGLSIFPNEIQSQDGLKITFEFSSYGGNGADGITFFLMDGATTTYSPGGSGGALGYSPRITEPGTNTLDFPSPTKRIRPLWACLFCLLMKDAVPDVV